MKIKIEEIECSPKMVYPFIVDYNGDKNGIYKWSIYCENDYSILFCEDDNHTKIISEKNINKNDEAIVHKKESGCYKMEDGEFLYIIFYPGFPNGGESFADVNAPWGNNFNNCKHLPKNGSIILKTLIKKQVYDKRTFNNSLNTSKLTSFFSKNIDPLYELINTFSPYFICHHFIGNEIHLGCPKSNYWKSEFNKSLIKGNDILKTGNIKCINDYDIVQCQVDYLEYFYYKVLPNIDKKIILITSQSHLPQIHRSDMTDSILNHPNILLWISTNPIYYNNKKYMAFPYGLDPKSVNEYYNFIKGNTIVKKEKVFNSPNSIYPHFQKNHIRRKNKLFLKPKIEYNEYLTKVSENEFTISTAGDREDGHKHWECIGLESIPVTNMNYFDIFGDNMYYSHVDEIYDIINNVKRLNYIKPNRDIITLNYWKNIVNSKRINLIFEDLGPIEKKIHISWKNKNILHLNYSIIKNGIKNLKDMNPDYEFIIYDDNDIDNYLIENLSKEDYNLIKNKKIVEKTDLWRLLKIYNEGGIYTDLDRLYNIPLSNIIQNNIKCILPIYKEKEYILDFSQDIMISCSKNLFHKTAIDLNLERRRNGEDRLLYLGPDTYLHAISRVLIGEQIYRIQGLNNTRDSQFNDAFEIISSCKYLDTCVEKPPYNTLTYQGECILFDKDLFYSNQNVIHHTK